MTATIGRFVHYRLNAADAEAINRRREDSYAYRRAHPAGDDIPAGEVGRTGHIAHVGNQAEEGQCYPAVGVRTWGTDTHVNLSVLLDGTDTYWATSRGEGDQPGQWTWPPEV